MDESLLDFGIVCLVCLCTSEDFNLILNKDDENPEMHIYEKIAYCSNMKLSENLLEKLPSRICTICLEELDTSWRFRKKCEAANKIFHGLLKPVLAAEEIVKLTLEEHKLKLPPGIKVKCINTPHLQTTPKIPTLDQSIEQEENLLHLPMSSSSTTTQLKEEESDMNSLSLNLNPSHSDGGDVLDFADIANVGNFMTINEDSTTTQQIEYVYDAEYYDESNGATLSITVLPSHDEREEPSVTISVNEDIKDNILIKDVEPLKPDPVLTIDMNITNDITTLSKTSTTFQSDQPVQPVQPVQQQETTSEIQNIETKKNDNKTNLQSPSLITTNDNKIIEFLTQKSKTGRPMAGTKAPAKICDLCGNSYKYQHALKAHMRRHSNERPYSCEVCNKAFVSNVELRRHMRVHTGQKPYGCQFCTRRFSDYGSSKKHERIHTGERPYVCEVCYKGFAYAHVLTEHRRIHTGEKKYPCTHCGIGFTKKIYLQAHEKYKCKQRLPMKEHGHHNIGELNGLYDANIDILYEASVNDDDGDDMTSVFEENKVLEECIVESEFISDTFDDHCMPHTGHGSNEGVEAVPASGMDPLIINTEFPEDDNTKGNEFA